MCSGSITARLAALFAASLASSACGGAGTRLGLCGGLRTLPALTLGRPNLPSGRGRSE